MALTKKPVIAIHGGYASELGLDQKTINNKRLSFEYITKKTQEFLDKEIEKIEKLQDFNLPSRKAKDTAGQRHLSSLS